MVTPHYPFDSHYLQLDNLKLHYLDEGSGEPIVMVHGNPSWSFYFRHAVLNLRDQYRCIVPDHIGMGYSDKPDDSQYTFTLDRRIDDLEKLLDSLEIHQGITLILHDWGGGIGMGYALRYPERIKRLIILNTAVPNWAEKPMMPWWIGLTRTPLGAFAVKYLNAFALGAAYLGIPSGNISREERRLLVSPYNSPKNRHSVLRFVQDIPLKPQDPAYATVAALADGMRQFADRPMLICWGMKDPFFDKRFLAEWEAYFPQASVHRFEKGGHYVLEDAHKDIMRLTKDFLQNNPL